MIRKSSIDLQEPAHQPIKSIIVIFWKSFGGLIRSFWPVLLYFFISSKGSNNWFFIVGSIGIALISFFFGILRYYHFLYHTKDKNLIISSGLFTKTTKNIPFDRIQSIRLEQKFIHRVLNLYSVMIDTAGTSKEEIEIPALEHKTANQIKDLISQYNLSQSKRTIKSGQTEIKTREEEVFRLTLPDILKLGLTANHIRNFFIILGVLLGVSTQLGELDPKYRIDKWIEYAIDYRGKFHFEWEYLLIIPFIVIISITVSIFFSLFTNYNLRVVKTDTGYRINQGLVNRKEQFAPYKKIQIFRWAISPLRRLLGLYNISIKQASSSETAVKKSIRIPGAPLEDVNLFLSRVFRKSDQEKTKPYRVHEKFLYRYFLYLVVIPSFVLAGTAWFIDENVLFFYAMLLTIIGSAGLYRYYLNWKLTLGENFLQIRRGVLTIKRERIFLHKLQGLRLFQTPYQQRHGLASIELYTAAGNISIPYFLLSDAQQIANYLLYKVESSNRAWM